MGSTRIFVVHLRELIKTAVFAILGIILIGLLIYFFIPKDKIQDTIYIPGTYSSAFLLHNEPVNIEVSVSENKITGIEIMGIDEVQEVFYPLVKPTFETLADEIMKTQSVDISVSSETQFTGDLLLKAVAAAIDQAKVDK